MKARKFQRIAIALVTIGAVFFSLACATVPAHATSVGLAKYEKLTVTITGPGLQYAEPVAPASANGEPSYFNHWTRAFADGITDTSWVDSSFDTDIGKAYVGETTHATNPDLAHAGLGDSQMANDGPPITQLVFVHFNLLARAENRDSRSHHAKAEAIFDIWLKRRSVPPPGADKRVYMTYTLSGAKVEATGNATAKLTITGHSWGNWDKIWTFKPGDPLDIEMTDSKTLDFQGDNTLELIKTFATGEVTVIPEPASGALLLFAGGLFGLYQLRFRNRKRQVC